VLVVIGWKAGPAIAVLVFFAAYLASGVLRLHVPRQLTEVT
jgi:hypothetical protein